MRRLRNSVVLVFALAAVASVATADVSVPNIIGSHMVLQRDIAVPIWGRAAPGEAVTVQLGEHKAAAKTDAAGNWAVKLPALKAGGPHTLTISGKNKIVLKDILVGEVWVCSGQSNMAFNVRGDSAGRKKLAPFNNPKIRLLTVARRPSDRKLYNVRGTWARTNPGNVAGFSAVGYFFGHRLNKELGVPIGLINTSWGGTRIEPWTPRVGFRSQPGLAGVLKHLDASVAKHRAAVAKSLDAVEAWTAAARKALADKTPLARMPQLPAHPLAGPRGATGLYNGMVHPLVPFAIRGAIWYQGESNRHDSTYLAKMKALIGGWRQVWGQGDFPFYFVQLAPYGYGGEHARIPVIWEAQTDALAIPNTGMAVTLDIGNVRDIHPKNKFDVGNRLALWALAKDYGRDRLIYSGPLYKSMAVEGKTIRIQFDHVGGGLVSRDSKPLTWFEIAGKDGKYVKAGAKIDGETVVVSSDAVAEPLAARFAWSSIAEPNLMNKEGLPAGPFRTQRPKPASR
jgi:sialate O-acetylesterase